MSEHQLVERKVNVTFSQHAGTGLWSAQSDDLHGFMIFGHSLDEVMDRIRDSLRALIEAEGHEVVSVEPEGGETTDWRAPVVSRNVEVRYAA